MKKKYENNLHQAINKRIDHIQKILDSKTKNLNDNDLLFIHRWIFIEAYGDYKFKAFHNKTGHKFFEDWLKTNGINNFNNLWKKYSEKARSFMTTKPLTRKGLKDPSMYFPGFSWIEKGEKK